MESRRELLCKGYLRKSPPENKMEKNYKWRKRYFKLWSDKTLEYYKDEYEQRPLKEPLDLGSCMALSPCDENLKKYLRKDYPWLFSLPMPGRCYHFAARTEGEMITWKREISKMCNFREQPNGEEEGSADQVDSLSDVELPRTTSASSHSTSSTSSKSSPNQWRVNGSMSDSPTLSLSTPPYRTASVSSNQERTSSYRSPELNGRISLLSSVNSSTFRTQSPRSPPESPGAQLSTGSPFPPTELEGNYDVLRSPVRALEETHEAHYDVPPPTIHLQYLSYKGRSVSLKQTGTSDKASSADTGYVDMKPKEDDYLEYENDNEPEKIEKTFLSPPWMNNTKAKSMKVRPNVLKGPSPKRTNTITLDNGFHHQPIVLNDTIHDKIPEVKNKTVKEVVSLKDTIPDPPRVHRGKKPPPRIDRRKKPSLQSENSFQEDQMNDINGNGMCPLNKEFDNIHIRNHASSHNSSESNYCNNPITALQEDNDYMNCTENVFDNYDNLNLRSSIRRDANGKKLTVGENAQINLPLFYSLEPLPPSPSNNEPSSPTSPYENTNEVFLSLQEEGSLTNYENVESISKGEKAASLQYSEVQTSSWSARRSLQSETPTNDTATGHPADTTGTHYVFVDISKSAGLKLSKRSMEIGLAE